MSKSIERQCVVATLSENVHIPYSCLSSSPDGRLVIMGAQDTVRIVSVKPSGLKEVRSVRIAQYFQVPRSVGAITNDVGSGYARDEASVQMNVRNLFSVASSQNKPNNISIHVSDISWSITQNDFENPDGAASSERLMRGEGKGALDYTKNINDPFHIFSMPGDLRMADDSLIAAAGSNGVVLVWRACDLLRILSDTNQNQNDFFRHYYNNHQSGRHHSDSSLSFGYPEVILVEEHSKAVKLAWHPRIPGLLLTASLDGTAKLWERIHIDEPESDKNQNHSKWNFLAAMSTSQDSPTATRRYSWKWKRTFKPNCGAIRDVKWNNYNNDIFAMVTSSGFLVIYNCIVSHRPTIRPIAAHAREATTLDWHPTKPYTIATGGVDRTVKVWNLEADISLSHIGKNLDNIRFNASSHISHNSHESGGSTSDDASPKSEGLDHSYHGIGIATSSVTALSLNRSTHGHTISAGGPLLPNEFIGKLLQPSNTRTQRNTPRNTPKHIHELSIGVQVAKLKWRPPNNPSQFIDREPHLPPSSNILPDKHDAMLAVATSVSGAAAGGCGKVYLYRLDRPFMPLSVIDGHQEKSVADFVWLDTPELEEYTASLQRGDVKPRPAQHASALQSSKRGRWRIQKPSNSPQYEHPKSLSGTFQHVLTVGIDGKCLVQSFCRGERPISDVPPSAFSIANLSPFQEGFGSLQIIGAHQNVPSGAKNDYALCGLRHDRQTSQASGIFNEQPVTTRFSGNKFQWDPTQGDLMEQSMNLELTFSTTDHGDLKDVGKKPKSDEIRIAPEVVHLSRFANGYKLHRDTISKTKASVCRHNSQVAKELNCMALAQMWNMLASILEGAGTEDLSEMKPGKGFPKNALSFALLPTVKSLLVERADAGDVQTCVVICEVLEVIPAKEKNMWSSNNNTKPTVAVPGLSLTLVRQWYLSYIELLQQMCLFSHATSLIRICRDPEVAKLNQQSTTIHVSCPTCSEPLQGNEKTCRKCRQKIGLCFLCHERVKGVFVWCPGCGHGGHLECALEWFGSGGIENRLNEMCPTGCGHKCNLFKGLNNKAATCSFGNVCQEVPSTTLTSRKEPLFL